MSDDEARNIMMRPEVRYPLIINRSDHRCPIGMYIQWNPVEPIEMISPENIESLITSQREIQGEITRMCYGKMFGE